MQKVEVQMSPKPYDTKRIFCSQGDTELRKFGFILKDGINNVDITDISDPVFTSFPVEVGGTEELLPTNTSTPATSPIVADIRYPDGLRQEESFTYRESPTTVSGNAKLKALYGNTLVWNQLHNGISTSPASSNGITFTKVDETKISLSGTSTQGFTRRFNDNLAISIVTGHKYLLMSDHADVANIRLGLYQNNWDWASSSYVPLSGGIITATMTSDTARFAVQFTTANTTVNNLVLIPQIFDLTAMFGAGNEPSTVEEFTSLFPLNFYPYGQKLLDFKGTEIKTTGKNQVLKVIENSNIDSTGKLIADSQTLYDMAVAHVIKGQQYTFQPSHLNEIMGYFLTEPSIGSQTYDKSRITNGTSTFTAQITGYVAIRLVRPQTNAQLELGPVASNYEPYTENTTNLPTLTYFPTGMKSAGSVRDELTDNKAITRLIKTVVDGTNKTASYYGTFQGHQLFYIDVFAQTLVSTYSESLALLSNKYITANNPTMDDKNIRYQNTGPAWNIGRIYWNDDRYTSASAMNTALQSDPLEIISLAQNTVEESIMSATLVTNDAEVPLYKEGDLMVGDCTEELSKTAGIKTCKIRFTDADGDCYSNKIKLSVEERP